MNFHLFCVVGAAAAVSALAQPKAGSVATAMLRANQPGTVQLSSPGTSSTTAHVGPVGGLHAMQQRALIPVRPSNPVTPPATRSVSPAVSTVLHNQTDPPQVVYSYGSFTLPEPDLDSDPDFNPIPILSSLEWNLILSRDNVKFLTQYNCSHRVIHPNRRVRVCKYALNHGKENDSQAKWR